MNEHTERPDRARPFTQEQVNTLRNNQRKHWITIMCRHLAQFQTCFLHLRNEQIYLLCGVFLTFRRTAHLESHLHATKCCKNQLLPCSGKSHLPERQNCILIMSLT